MRRIALIAMTLLAGCTGGSTVKSKATAHWESRPQYGGSELRLLVLDSDQKILIEIIHGSGPDASWDVFKNGAGYGDYTTEVAAKKAAEKLVDVEVAGMQNPIKTSGDAYTQTPNSPAVTGDGNVIIYEDEKRKKP